MLQGYTEPNRIDSTTQRSGDASFRTVEPVALRAAVGDRTSLTGLVTRGRKGRISAMRLSASRVNINFVGFPPDAKAAFQAAADVWERYLQTNVPIEVEARWRPLDRGVLSETAPAYEVADFNGAPLSRIFYPAALANALSGQDLVPSSPDVIVSVNSDFGAWNADVGTPASDGEYDLVSVALHELTHGLGFTGRWKSMGGPELAPVVVEVLLSLSTI